ncbi:uncharacterized protein JCM6883_005268 [Sporobolomyces salmoneus]|uniref:uncharacterized protein n=1 Tax=Sporobolomyces salmoneus TaxID=183962 RepID=UPI00316C8D2E
MSYPPHHPTTYHDYYSHPQLSNPSELPPSNQLPYPPQPAYSHSAPVHHSPASNHLPTPPSRIVLTGSFASASSPHLPQSHSPSFTSYPPPLAPIPSTSTATSDPNLLHQYYTPQPVVAASQDFGMGISDRPRRSTSRVPNNYTTAPQQQAHHESSYATRRTSGRALRGTSSAPISYAEPRFDDDEGDYQEEYQEDDDDDDEEVQSRSRSGARGKGRATRGSSSRGGVSQDFEQQGEEEQDGLVDTNGLPPLPPIENGQNGGGASQYLQAIAGVTGAVDEEQQQEEEQPVARNGRRIVQDSDDNDDAEGEMDVSTINPAQIQNNYQPEAQNGENVEPEDESDEGVEPRRRATRVKIANSDEEGDEAEEEDELGFRRPTLVMKTASGRTTKRPVYYDEGDDGDEAPSTSTGGRLTRGGSRRNGGYRGEGIDEDEEEWAGEDGQDDSDDFGTRRTRNSSRGTRSSNGNRRNSTRSLRNRAGPGRPPGRQTRNSIKAQDTSYDDEEGPGSSDEDDLSLDLHDDEDSEFGGGGSAPRRNLRQKKKVDYFAPLALEAPKGRKDKKKNQFNKKRNDDGNPFAGLPANLTGAQWAALYPDGGQPSDSSDDDIPNLGSPSKSALYTSKAGGIGGGGMLASGGGLEFGAGAPGNLGKVASVAALADTDPLGVPSTISFDSVGGLGSHIQQLKEMVSLPLLYPEVFERFAITPPRGVLFHGPPGTGKTLLARALAASCSTDGRKISFFMRKGADCLSKWVGEAERQLRLLFEEAKNCQPSIIFFDEIDGLAPVRSSKQEQIHASIVSTLLALMDGMDGRGQVIVIGATNRPDAIDPALRRPGRFDREFYFPLPNIEARKKILGIHTKGWNPPLEDSFMDELADLTKGYGGADLRALCTEAALNAVQRTYPQIYKTNDRLLIKPETIEVTARDFVISQKNLIPSSHRSTSSAAAALPPQLVPLLAESFENAKVALSKVLPEVKKPNVLEEAEFVDDGGGFEKEKMLQAFETLRVFRPRLLILGEPGSGQGFVGSAILHHLEGFHVQTLDLATLVSDSSRTMEAACVQLFVEAKRHKPSILFIPSLLTWCTSVGETVRSTIKGLLDSLDPSDPILLLAVVDGSMKDIPPDVRSWFGFVKGNRVVLDKPNAAQREAFFADVIAGITRPPNEFPDAMPRRKRILEKLPIAPPPAPREPTAAEIAQAEANDQRLLEYLKWKLGPVLGELKKRYKRFTRNLYDDWREDDLEWRKNQLNDNETVTGLGTQPYHNVDLDLMHSDLYKGYYHTPDEFLTDILRIQANAEINKIMEQDAEAPIKAGQMVNHTKVMLDQTFDANFRSECVKMAARMKEKDQNQPKKERKGRGRPLPEEGIVAAAKQAAIDGGLHKVRPPKDRATEGEGEDEGGQDDVIIEENGDVGAGENGLKRAREEGQDDETEGVEGEGGQGPAKRMRPEGDESPSVDAVDLPNGQVVASTSAPQPLSNGINGHHYENGASSNLNNLLNPTSPSALATSQNPLEFAQPPPLGALAMPMAVGATPSLSPQKSLANAEPNFFIGNPPSATSNPFLVPSFSAAVDPSPSTTTPDTTLPNGVAPPAPSDENSREGEEPIGAEKERSPTPMEATPPPLPDFILPSHAVDAFASFLKNDTSALNVDQLEQLRAACFDSVWRGKGDWDRTRLLEELDELAKEFVEEVETLPGAEYLLSDMLTEHWSACVVSAACSYNSEPYGIKNIFSLVSKEILYEGFIVLNRDLGNFYDEIPPALAKGEFTKPIEHVTMGLDQGEAFLELLNGGNIGKAVISLE